MTDKNNGGWISPDGDFQLSNFAQHELDAVHIWKLKYEKEYERLSDKWYDELSKLPENKYRCKLEFMKDELILQKGWIELTGNPYPMMGFSSHMYIACKRKDKITAKQFETIKRLEKEGLRLMGYREMEKEKK